MMAFCIKISIRRERILVQGRHAWGYFARKALINVFKPVCFAGKPDEKKKHQQLYRSQFPGESSSVIKTFPRRES
jgi:hypothetical protein